MGVLPLEFRDGESREHLGLDGTETFDISLDVRSSRGRRSKSRPQNPTALRSASRGPQCRIDTPVEVEYYRHGGILHKVLRDLAHA